MAQIEESGGGHEKGSKPKAKKHSTNMDMTPMVDLGFLLLTFFILTTTLSKPQAMPLTMPEKPKEEDKNKDVAVKESESVTILLGKNNKVFYFQGKANDPATKEKMVTTDFSPNGIRKSLLQLKAGVGKDDAGDSKLVAIIKATETAKYRNVVDILDEMNITGVKKYAIVDVSPEELKLISDVNK